MAIALWDGRAVRGPAKITATSFSDAGGRCSPFRMERVAADVESVHFGVGDLDALLIGPLIERTLDLEPGFGRRRGDQLNHCGAADEWLGAPVLRDVAEQPVLDLVPFRCAGRIVADLDRRGDLVGHRRDGPGE